MHARFIAAAVGGSPALSSSVLAAVLCHCLCRPNKRVLVISRTRAQSLDDGVDYGQMYLSVRQVRLPLEL